MGHRSVTVQRAIAEGWYQPNVTGGFCECGCGERTPLAEITRRERGQVKGQPVRFVHGHNRRGSRNSEEHNRKIGLTKAGERNPNFGKRHSDEQKRKISESVKRAYAEGRIIGLGTNLPSGEDHHNWNGGRKMRGGYVYVKLDPDHRFAPMRLSDGYVAEHRLVMAEHLGRPLSSEEVVHHINEVTDDNRLENMMLFPSHAAHISFHRKSK